MDLFLLRHGTAVDVGAPEAPDDESRYLSEEGVEEITEAARGLTLIEKDFEAILTSRYRRARQTAEIVAKTLGIEDRLHDSEALLPGASLDSLADAIKRRRLSGPILAIGHNPDFEEMVSEALTEDLEASVNIRKGGLATIRFRKMIGPGEGELRVLMTCRHLRWIGAAV